jgi:hypothetical protein
MLDRYSRLPRPSKSYLFCGGRRDFLACDRLLGENGLTLPVRGFNWLERRALSFAKIEEDFS